MYKSGRHWSTLFCLIAVLAAGAAGCGEERAEPEEPAQLHVVPALRFAGVNLIYALRRVAAEAKLLLALDELQPRDLGPDLDRFRVDVDLPAGPVQEALGELKAQTGTFDFRLSDDVIYVRSALSLQQTTGFDVKDLPAAELKVNIEELVRWIMMNRKSSYLKVKRVRGEPIFRVVELNVPEKSSVLNVLLMYAKKAHRGWRIRRAGQVTHDPQGRLGIIANTVALWGPLDEPNKLPRARMDDSIVAALASVSQRTKTPICITDASPLGNFRGWLDYGRKTDPQMDARESVGTLAWPGVTASGDHFAWETLDGIIRVNSQFYTRLLPGQDLLNDAVKGGRFDGTLPELARWLNQNRAKPSPNVLMGGEITGDGPTARLQIAAGSTVESVLQDFARASGAGWNLVIIEPDPDSASAESHPNAWVGAFLTPLALWSP